MTVPHQMLMAVTLPFVFGFIWCWWEARPWKKTAVQQIEELLGIEEPLLVQKKYDNDIGAIITYKAPTKQNVTLKQNVT